MHFCFAIELFQKSVCVFFSNLIQVFLIFYFLIWYNVIKLLDVRIPFIWITKMLPKIKYLIV